ncbi:MAG: ABC transporter substrate-binding protein [Deltaproteobacteria bacterium]|jgi:MarR-like DNA-binding transcriptional regulator SgrR of sgrS sRNA
MKRLLVSLSLCVASVATAAPRTPYGGDARVYVFGRPIEVLPENAAGFADATVQGLVYERLYGLDGSGDLVPILAAGPPEIAGLVVSVPLRPRVQLHDGRVLTAAMVAEAFVRHATTDARASYVTALTLDGAGRPRVRSEAGQVRFQLTTPHADFARLLASPHAAVDVPAVGRAQTIGTGPYRFHSRDARGVYLFAPFDAYRGGRPFLDGVEVRPYASRFGAAALTKNAATTLVFGIPDGSDRASPRIEVAGSVRPRAETLVLAIGPSVADRDALAQVIDGALNRQRLVRRFLGDDAQATQALLDGVKVEATEPKAPTASRSLALLVSRDGRAGHRFAERVQLDLLRAGITVRIERVSPERLEARRRGQDFELLIDTLAPVVPASPRPVDDLHALWSIASMFAQPQLVRAADVERFERSGRPAEVVAALEASFRRSLGLVPIARRAPSVASTDTLHGVTSRPSGAMDLSDAHR